MAEYAGASVDWEHRQRLESLARGLDPTTIRMLEALEVGPGWRCVEIGAGAGTIAAWLHERVGAEGHVLATDLETRWLEMLDLPGLEIRRHDVGSESLGESLYDLIHCRAVLLHVPDWRKALRHMVAALRPGGWLLVEDGEWLTTGLSHPPCEAVARLWDATKKLIHAAGGDVSVGRQLVSAYRELGLVDVDGNASALLGGFKSDLLPMVEPVLPLVVGAGLLTKEDAEEASGYLKDAGNFSLGPLVISIQGRKPMAGG
jgi:trans-aconitate methyltransferase